MRMEVYSTPCTTLRRPLGGCSEINEVPPSENSRFTHYHIWGTLHTVFRDSGLSKLQTLCSLSDDPSNPTYLSLGNFLIGEPLTQLPTIDLNNVKVNRLSSWQMHQQQLQKFWPKMVQGLSSEPTTASAMAENNTQPTVWEHGPGQRGQNFTLAVANSCHPWHSPR